MDASAGNVCLPVGGTTTQTTTGGNKPLHRFLRAEPKIVGIVMMFMGSCMFIFGIPMRKDMSLEIQADIYSSFWLGILYFICGLLYIQSEREPTKKIITASFALSTLSIIASAIAAISFIITMTFTNEFHYFDPSYYSDGYNTSLYLDSVKKHFLPIYSLEVVFLSYSLIGIVILITMTIFGRMALRSTRTQAVVVMRNIPATG
ncbi:membrane-spanning 4-domains subfamily A member 15-like [Astyanax mexicanus]|uniref:Membrane-spanning 4-domains subfamily A member 15-like n=1 Tax=Astyanax mexicanus TaxID=7994 RepID=A0A8T2KLP2_ASTMX|nr:membrane-spanning 4-domains subfamily A member 15-like [Astyanax mexicanus]